METREFVNCTCGTEGLIINHDPDDGDVYLAIWSYGQVGKRASYVQRARWIWNIITKGLLWNDQVILSPESSKILAHSLLARVAQYEEVVKDDTLKNLVREREA